MKSLSDLNTLSNTQLEFVDENAFGVVWDRDTPTGVSITAAEATTIELPTGINLLEMSDPETADMSIEIDLSVLTQPVTLTFPEGLPDGVQELEVSTNVFAYQYIKSPAAWDIVATPTIELPSGVAGDGLEIIVSIDYTTLDSTGQSLEYIVELSITASSDLETPSTVEYTPQEINFDPSAPLITFDTSVIDPEFEYTMTPSITGAILDIRTNPSDSTVDSTTGIFDETDESFKIVGTKGIINDHLANLEIDFTTYNPDFLMRYRLDNLDDSTVQRAIQRFNSPEGYGAVDAAFAVPQMTSTKVTGILPSVNSAFSVPSVVGIDVRKVDPVDIDTTSTTTNSANIRQRYGAVDSIDSQATLIPTETHRYRYLEGSGSQNLITSISSGVFGPQMALLTVTINQGYADGTDQISLLLNAADAAPGTPFYYVDWDDGNPPQYYENTFTSAKIIQSPLYSAYTTKKVRVWGGNTPADPNPPPHDFTYYTYTNSYTGSVVLTHLGNNSGFINARGIS